MDCYLGTPGKGFCGNRYGYLAHFKPRGMCTEVCDTHPSLPVSQRTVVFVGELPHMDGTSVELEFSHSEQLCGRKPNHHLLESLSSHDFLLQPPI